VITRLTPTLLYAILLLPALCWAEDYVYPAKVEPDIACELDAQQLAALKIKFAHDRELPGLTKANVVDLNADGVCEIFLTSRDTYSTSISTKSTLLVEQNGKYMRSPGFQQNFQVIWYGETRNDYLQILTGGRKYYGGAVSFVTEVHYHDGEGYIKEEASGSTYRQLIKLGREAYRLEEYATAERHFLNAFRSWSSDKLTDANNLGLVWIKLGRPDEAEELLLKHIAVSSKNEHLDLYHKENLATAHFNLGLIAEARNDLATAFDYYARSYAGKRNTARRKKLDDIMKQMGIKAEPILHKCVNASGDTTYTDSRFGCAK